MMTAREVYLDFTRLKERYEAERGALYTEKIVDLLREEGKAVTKEIVEEAFKLAGDFDHAARLRTRIDEDTGEPYIDLTLDEANSVDPGPAILEEQRRRG